MLHWTKWMFINVFLDNRLKHHTFTVFLIFFVHPWYWKFSLHKCSNFSLVIMKELFLLNCKKPGNVLIWFIYIFGTFGLILAPQLGLCLNLIKLNKLGTWNSKRNIPSITLFCMTFWPFNLLMTCSLQVGLLLAAIRWDFWQRRLKFRQLRLSSTPAQAHLHKIHWVRHRRSTSLLVKLHVNVPWFP